MKKLIQGIINFRKNSLKNYREKFSKFAEGQSPDTLLISCCDSRVVPNIFTGTDPGDIFVLRNIGNLVPPYGSTDNSVAATLEYAVFKLKVSYIIVCGHSGCGAMATLGKELPAKCESLKSWLEHAGSPTEALGDDNLTKENRISQINVLQQLEHLKTYPYIAERLQTGILKIHGWWFDLRTADTYRYEPESIKFILI